MANYTAKVSTNCAFVNGKPTDTWSEEFFCSDPIAVSERFDETLDSMEISWISTTDTMIEKWRKVRLYEDRDVMHEMFVESCVVKTAGIHDGAEIYRKTVRGIELTKVLQKIVMDNLTDSQPLSGTKRTVRDVLERLIRLMFTLPVNDYAKRPLWVKLDENIAGLDRISPEFFFTEKTAFECFQQVGEFLGGFPRLLRRGTDGYYTLTFRQWDNPNVIDHSITSGGWGDITKYSGIDNHAEVVESYAKNMLFASDNGEDELVYPAPGAYKSVNTTEFETTITGGGVGQGNSNARVDLPFDIYKLIKCEIKIGWSSITGLGAMNTEYFDITTWVQESEIWKTLKEKSIFAPADKKRLKELNLRYSYSHFTIENFQAIANIAVQKKFISDDYTYKQLTTCFRITYIPLISARVKTRKPGNAFPITQIVNQNANVIKSSTFANYLQGLADRMVGEYETRTIRLEKGSLLPHVGSKVDGKWVVAVDYELKGGQGYADAEILICPEFNRKSEFVAVPTEVRQWEIPADGKVTDRYVHYGEKCRVSINEPLTDIKDNSSLTTAGKNLFFDSFRGSGGNEICLAMCAFVSPTQLANKNLYDNNGFAMASVVSAPFGNSLLFHFGMADNASAGVRGYHTNALDGLYSESNRQQFISYVNDAIGGSAQEYGKLLRVKLTSAIPSHFNYDNDFTGTGSETDSDSNKTFEFTFPMSNKEQYINSEALCVFDENYFQIEKDIRERILFDYQLYFEGEEGVMIGDLSRCGLISSARTQKYSLWLSKNNKERYSKWDNAPKGTVISTISNSIVEIFDTGILLDFGQGLSTAYQSLAITDQNDKIIFMTNKSGYTDGKVRIYFAFEKMQPKPL